MHCFFQLAAALGKMQGVHRIGMRHKPILFYYFVGQYRWQSADNRLCMRHYTAQQLLVKPLCQWVNRQYGGQSLAVKLQLRSAYLKGISILAHSAPNAKLSARNKSLFQPRLVEKSQGGCAAVVTSIYSNVAYTAGSLAHLGRRADCKYGGAKVAVLCLGK